MYKVLVTDSIHPSCAEYLRKDPSVDVEVMPDIERDALLAIIGNYDAIAVRSRVGLDTEMVQAGKKLKVISRCGVGVDHIDVDQASKQGIIVVNSPRGNIIAAAEQTMALMLASHRYIAQGDKHLRENKWERKQYLGRELYQKTLGIVGLGKIGTLVSERARAFGMSIIAYDPFVTEAYAAERQATLVPFETLLATADVVTFHTPLTDVTKGMMGAEQFALMKEGSVFINCARGKIVALEALKATLDAGKIFAAGLDVFPVEPPIDNPILSSDRAVFSPHLGGNTLEAQIRIAVDIAQGMLDVLHGKVPASAVNSSIAFPTDDLDFYQPFLDLSAHLGVVIPQISKGTPGKIEITYAGAITEKDTAPIKAYILMSLLKKMGIEQVNLINVLYLANEKGIQILESTNDDVANYTSLISVKVLTEVDEHIIAGTVTLNAPHLVRIDDYWIDIIPEGHLLITYHKDQPGVIGELGTLLGDENINIASMEVGRTGPREQAIMVVTLDERPSDAVLDKIRANPKMNEVQLVDL